jgi:hypothetical protein
MQNQAFELYSISSAKGKEKLGKMETGKHNEFEQKNIFAAI